MFGWSRVAVLVIVKVLVSSEKCPGQSRSRATVVADATHQIEWGGRVRDVKEPAIHRN